LFFFQFFGEKRFSYVGCSVFVADYQSVLDADFGPRSVLKFKTPDFDINALFCLLISKVILKTSGDYLKKIKKNVCSFLTTTVTISLTT
jgi:hypothetical protein